MLVSDENVNPPAINEFGSVVTAIKVVILAVFLVPLVHYTVFHKEENGKNATDVSNPKPSTIIEEIVPVLVPSVDEVPVEEMATDVRKILPQQPSCPRSQMRSILIEICEELVMRSEQCAPEDFNNRDKHKIPKHYAREIYSSSKKAPQLPAIVNWTLGGLLVTSLCAALIELYKAKRQPEKKNGKNPLSRKCSLADLTVLKHHRKEMVRRDSLMEVPEEGLYAKQLGSAPPPLHRRCSFPVGPGIPPFAKDSIYSNRRQSLTKSTAIAESRRPSVIYDSRKQSVVIDSRRTSVAGPVSCAEEEAKRHHVRLVHRH